MKNTISILIATLLVSFSSVAQFQLPELPFPYEAYEKAVDATTMEIHHSKHHAGYTKNLNQAVEQLGLHGMRIEDIMEVTSKFPATIRNNGGGYYNHTLFWEILSPEATEASDKLNAAIESSFGSKDEMIQVMNKLTASQFGSGWGWVIVTPSGRLKIVTTANQDNPLMDVVPEEDRGIPIIGIDVWEHAYYLRYQNLRAKYLSNIWSIINWEEVSKKYEMAIKSMN